MGWWLIPETVPLGLLVWLNTTSVVGLRVIERALEHPAANLDDAARDDRATVDVQGETQEVTIAGNDIRETRGPSQRVGIRLGAKTSQIQLEGNRFSGLKLEVEDLRT